MEFLTADELIALTGYKWHSKQIKKLKEQRYQIKAINRFGMPLVVYKDVFGFKRHEQPSNPPADQRWQPPPLI